MAMAHYTFLLIVFTLKASNGHVFNISMPRARPITYDSYLCTSLYLREELRSEEPIYASEFKVTPGPGGANAVHHVILYGCEAPGETGAKEGRIIRLFIQAELLKGRFIVERWRGRGPKCSDLPTSRASKREGVAPASTMTDLSGVARRFCTLGLRARPIWPCLPARLSH